MEQEGHQWIFTISRQETRTISKIAWTEEEARIKMQKHLENGNSLRSTPGTPGQDFSDWELHEPVMVGELTPPLEKE